MFEKYQSYLYNDYIGQNTQFCSWATKTWIIMKEGNVLFNNTLNKFDLWLRGVGTHGKEPFK